MVASYEYRVAGRPNASARFNSYYAGPLFQIVSNTFRNGVERVRFCSGKPYHQRNQRSTNRPSF